MKKMSKEEFFILEALYMYKNNSYNSSEWDSVILLCKKNHPILSQAFKLSCNEVGVILYNKGYIDCLYTFDSYLDNKYWITDIGKTAYVNYKNKSHIDDNEESDCEMCINEIEVEILKILLESDLENIIQIYKKDLFDLKDKYIDDDTYTFITYVHELFKIPIIEEKINDKKIKIKLLDNLYCYYEE